MNPFESSSMVPAPGQPVVARNWQRVTAVTNTVSRGFIWTMLLLYCLYLLPPVCSFMLDVHPRPSPLLRLSISGTAWLRQNVASLVGLLLLLLGMDLLVRWHPPRGPSGRTVFLLWHLGSLWLPILLLIVYTFGLFLPLVR